MNVNITRIDRSNNGMVQFYNGSDVVDSFSITSSVSVGFENNTAKTIVFSNSIKTLSFNVYNLTTLYGSTSSKIYSSGIDPSDTSSAYISRLYDIYGFLISDMVQGCCPGPTFVGGVVATYPNFASFPATGQTSVIYIDESTSVAYFWNGTNYEQLVSTSVADKMATIGRNSTGSTLYKGTIIYISGSTGNRPNFVKAQANSEATSAGTFGVILDDIPNNSDGYAVTIGTIDNLDTRSTATHPFTTDTLADGDTIYLSPTTAGYITNVKPYAPSHLVYVGKVVRTSPTNGTIVYRIQNGYELDEIHDVAAQTPSNNDVLAFESATTLWKNKSISTVLGYTPENVANKQTDLTASATKYPTVNAVNTGLATKENTITAGTTSQYWRGDKTWQTFPTIPSVTPSALTKVDDTNVTLTLGGTPATALLQGVSLTLGWTGTLADARIASASIWNAKQGAISLTTTGSSGSATFLSNVLNIPTYTLSGLGAGTWASLNYPTWVSGTPFVKMTAAGTFALDTNTYYLASNPSGYTSNIGTVTSIATSGPITGGTITGSGTIGISQSTTSTDGYLSSTDWNTFNGKQAALVSGTNIKTINSTSVLGSGDIAVQATLVSGTNIKTINGSSVLGSGDLSVGTFTLPSLTSGSVLFSNGTTIAQNNANFFWDNTNNRLGIGTSIPQDSFTVSGQLGNLTSELSVINTNGGKVTFRAGVLGVTNSGFTLLTAAADGTSETARLAVSSTGNLLIGTTTDAGYKLDVNGTARVQGNLTLAGTTTIGGGYGVTSGTFNIIQNGPNIVPSSGTMVVNGFAFTGTINQTGGANGITRGLYINPTLTSAADFRAIEVASGITVLGASTTAKASLRIPSGTAPTSPVNGDIWFDGTNIKMQIGGVTKTFTLV